MRFASVLLGLLALSCAPTTKQRLHPAGDKLDEGNGQLALASMHLYTDEETVDPPAQHTDSFDEAYGGTTYGNYTPPSWGYPAVNRNPVYAVHNDLVGAVEGTISWRGASPTATTSCGPVDWLRIGSHHELAGALVFIHRVATGRSLVPAQSEQRPAPVGGIVIKRGCALFPVVQLVTPVPARIAIHGDRTATRLRLTTTAFPMPPLAATGGKPARYGNIPYAPGNPDSWDGEDWANPSDDPEKTPEPHDEDLLEGGRIVAPIRSDIMRIDSIDNTVGSAWIVGLATPAYAITDEAGRFRLDELAKGTYEVTIFVPPPPAVKNGALVYGEPIVVKRSIVVPDGSHAVRVDVTVGK
ncbi:MAG TPA: carboxypeptidase-like regulatory domain-containing protein [Kofleriaceae bacterium]